MRGSERLRSILERAYAAYGEFRQYDPKTVAPHTDETWCDAIENTSRWRPMIDGAFTSADHLRAWDVAPPTYVAVQPATSAVRARRARIVQAAQGHSGGVFWQSKEARGLRRFSLHRFNAVRGEVAFIAMTHNLLELFRGPARPIVASTTA